MRLTLGEIHGIKHLRAIGFTQHSLSAAIHDVSTDSRLVKKRDLFVALRGEKYDGHVFLKAAEEKGAIAAVVDEKWFKDQTPKHRKFSIPLLVVRSTLDAYGDIAHLYRSKFNIPVILIAGSNGKTTTKEVLSHVLGSSFNVLKTEANFNNQVGLPKMLLRLRPKHQIAVLEIGTNHPGEIAWLTKVAEPTHGFITNIGREHLEFFNNVRGVAHEELALFRFLAQKKGFVFINTDDTFLAPQTRLFSGRNISFGSTAHADVTALSEGYTKDTRLGVRVQIGTRGFLCKTYIIADYAPSLIAGVTSVATYFGMTPSTIKNAIESYKPTAKRMEIVTLRSGSTAINDCYNANPESFLAALETLKRIPARGKKYVIAGDMFELGNTSVREHKLLGKTMAMYKFDGYYFTGAAMKQAFAALVNSNTKLSASYESTKMDIANAVRSVLKRGDVILVKGSRGMKMETIIEQL
ncbi:MAG: UDP-N-acetylmuramoyl-tripeptide--D-alanyl-D-alanine ligase [Bacteroidota bacterium]|nr:UDP-N-acetylmuramoyl-tripeptide--D-alanyl-D-alanine ligase [Bacteroidota bacterium]